MSITEVKRQVQHKNEYGGQEVPIHIIQNPVRAVNPQEEAVTSNPTHLAEEPDKKGKI